MNSAFNCFMQEWKIYCCELALSSEPQIWKFHVVVWQTTSKHCTKKRAARAARLFSFIQPIKSFDLWRCRWRCRRQILNSVMKDFLLRAPVVVRTSNMKIARRSLADYVKTLHQKACRTIIFLYSTNQIIDLWRCRWPTGRGCRSGRQEVNKVFERNLQPDKPLWIFQVQYGSPISPELHEGRRLLHISLSCSLNIQNHTFLEGNTNNDSDGSEVYERSAENTYNSPKVLLSNVRSLVPDQRVCFARERTSCPHHRNLATPLDIWRCCVYPRLCCHP